MLIETETSDGETDVKRIDGFIRSDDVLDHIVRPFSLILTSYCVVPVSLYLASYPSSYLATSGYFCFQVEEFCKVVDVRHLRTLEPGQLLVAWEGEIEQITDDGDTDSASIRSTNSDDSPPPSHLPSTGDTDSDTDQQMVTFKVIGVLRDPQIQTLLREIIDRRERGDYVAVRITPEPDNIFDSRAISFQASIDGEWKRIGYIVKEIVEEVHSAFDSNSIICTEFAWVRYKLWKKAPGYYAAVNITCSGQWPLAVHRARSTFY